MASRNVTRFTADLEKFSKKLDLDFGITVRKIAIDLFGAIVEKTPVLTGRARASWINAGRPDLSVAPEGSSLDKGAPNRKAEGFVNVNPYSKIFITNNLEYIVPLEQGHSDKAPRGMVALSLQEVTTFLGRVLK